MSEVAPNIVIAPDSFKGSCTSVEAARAIADGVRAAFGDRANVRELPMADGGEGTLDALVAAWGGEVVRVPTSDALGRPRDGRVGYGRTEGGDLRAIIEAADSNGLPAVSDLPLRPLDADSFGVGTLILAALDAGADELLLCVGGSATNDGGAGMLRALGARLLDAQSRDVAAGARGLLELQHIDLSGIDPRASRVKWRIACDVDNPLTGPRGAASVFAPQKGADARQVDEIERGLRRFSELLAATVGTDPTEMQQQSGIGAAGGLALGLVAILNARLVPGAQLVSEAIELPGALAAATLVFTGEGRLDAQSLDGKVVSRVIADAAAAEASVIVLAGSTALEPEKIAAAGIAAAFSIAQGPATLEQMSADATRLLESTARQVCGAILVAAKIDCGQTHKLDLRHG